MRPSSASARLPRGCERYGILAWLTVVAGIVDTVGYLFLDEVFTSNMTGNLSVFGLSVAGSAGGFQLRRGFVLLPFALGLLVGTLVVESSRERASLTRVFVTELAALVGFGLVALWLGPGRAHEGPAFFLAATLPALAMGIQNASLLLPEGRGTPPTHVTGALSRSMQGLVRLALGRASHGDRVASCQGAARCLGFAAGTLLGGLLWSTDESLAVFTPAVLLLPVLDVERARGRRASESSAAR